jgi:hypothetical protein
MKVMMVAVFIPTSTNCSQADGFENNGCEVIRYDYRKREKEIGSKRDQEIIDICKLEKPDFVFFSKCNEVNVSVIIECNLFSKTVLWYMDPLNVNFSSSLKEKIINCNYTFCALTEPYKEALKIKNNNVYFLQEGFDEKNNYPFDVPYINDVSFIGVLRNERQKYYDALRFKLYNNAYNEDHSKAVSETRINLNFTEGGTSDRTYKILASKGFLLTQSWENMENDFKIGRDLDIFNNIDDLKDKIKYYLKNEELRLEIANNGYKTVQKFNRTNFAKYIINKVKNDTI